MGRGRGLAVTALVVLALVAPGLRRPPRDSFPLSTYPMFSHDPGREVAVVTALGVTADGSRGFLSPEEIAGTDEPVQAMATARRAVEAGRGSAERLCAQIGRRVAGADVAMIEVVGERYDAVAYFAGERAPTDRVVYARCEAEGR